MERTLDAARLTAAGPVANMAVTQTPPGPAYSNQLPDDFIISDFIVANWTTHADPLTGPAAGRTR